MGLRSVIYWDLLLFRGVQLLWNRKICLENTSKGPMEKWLLVDVVFN